MLILLLMLPGLPGAVAAQAECEAVPQAAGLPDSSGFDLLFRQAGVSFSARVSGGPVAVALVNHNGFPVTVDFGTYLDVGSDSLPAGEHFLGRRCVRLSAGQTAELASEEAPEPVRAVRVRNLTITGLAVAAAPEVARASSARPAPERESVPPAPPAPERESAPVEAPQPTPSRPTDSAQFRCSEDAESAAGRACTASYLAASARAAALSGSFAGTTRECLLEYAAGKEQVAARLRQGGAAAGAPAPAEPPCFSAESSRWDSAVLLRSCPGAVWTPQNRGVTTCRFSSAEASSPELPAAPAPALLDGENTRAPEAAGAAVERGRTTEPLEPEASASEPREAIGLHTVLRLMRLIFGVVLTLAGLALSIAVLQAAALLLLVAPAALLRKLRREAAAD